MTDYRDFYRTLRADWLKLRGSVFDPNTQLPSLPLVLDGVRRRLEAGDALGLVYVDPSSGGHLESTHGWQAYDRLVRKVAEAIRESPVLTASAKETLALTAVRGDEIVVFPGLEASGPEAAAALERLRQAFYDDLQARLKENLETRFLTSLQIAAVPLVLEPTVRIERSVYQGLHRARERCRQESERRHQGLLAELDRILAERDVTIRYQPIVELNSGRVHGFEALSKAPESFYFDSPDVLFAFAEESDRILKLDRLCRGQAIRRSVPFLGADGRLAGSKLFLNCSAHVFHDEELIADLESSVGASGLKPDSLVLEITERVAITEWQTFHEALENLRRAGMRVAIDDMGSGYSSLRVVAEIQPDYLKFDRSLISGIHLSSIKREMLEALVTLARRINSRPIAEGIENHEEFETVRGMGIDYGQGYFFARPSEPEDLGGVYFPAPAAQE